MPRKPHSSGDDPTPAAPIVGSLFEDDLTAIVSRAAAARKSGDLDKAAQLLEAQFDNAGKGRQAFVDECLRLGMALVGDGRLADAARFFRDAHAAMPAYGPAQAGRGYILMLLRKFDKAIPLLDKAVATDNRQIEWLYWRGFARDALGLDDGAVEDFRTVLAENPDHAQALASLILINLRRADWTSHAGDVAHLEKLLADRHRRAKPAEIRPFTSLLLPFSRADQRRIAEDRAKTFRLLSPVERRDFKHDRIRIGYFSDHFRKHPTARLMAGLFAAHDRTRFEIFVYSTGKDEGGPWRPRIVEGTEHFVDLHGLDDRQIAERIAADQVDILLDLMVYIRDSRPGVMARRPAPLQVSYLGYPGTSGAPYIDYLVADPVTVPPEHERDYSEAIIRLPGSYQVNDTLPDIAAPPRADWGLPEDGVVFNCFNNSYKLEPESFAAWMEILRNVEGSVLWLIDSGEIANGNLRTAAKAAGIVPDRMIFAPRCPFETHLARQTLADLALDTFVYGAHTTASDALSVGVPVLTRLGPCFAGRVSASLLTALGLTDLIAADHEAYAATAIAIGKDKSRLDELRGRLSRALPRSALFQPNQFAANLETAFTRILDRYHKGLSPITLNI